MGRPWNCGGRITARAAVDLLHLADDHVGADVGVLQVGVAQDYLRAQSSGKSFFSSASFGRSFTSTYGYVGLRWTKC